MQLRALGATQQRSAPAYCPLQGQGATEYLVLLAVVLIVALVSVALLGFFPGMASDAQRAQSEMSWRSASPIAITEWAAKAWTINGKTFPYLRIRNSGAYPIRITAIVGANGNKNTQFFSNDVSCGMTGAYNISDYFYLGPGEEKYFGYYLFYGLPCDRYLDVTLIGTTGTTYTIRDASSLCTNSSSTPGQLILNSLGFEYIEYLDNNQQITKRQTGPEVAIRCMPAST